MSHNNSNNIWKFTNNEIGKSIWQLFDADNKQIGQSSQVFASKGGAEYNAKLLGYNGNFSKQLIWEFFQENNLWNWKCHNSVNKENVGTSFKGFGTKAEAEDNAGYFGFPHEHDSADMMPSGMSNITHTFSELHKDTQVISNFNGGGSSSFATIEKAENNPISDSSFDVPNTTMADGLKMGLGATAVGGIAATATNAFKSTNLDMGKTIETPSVDGYGWDAKNEEKSWFGIFGFWKWLIPLLLILGLLWLLWSWLSGTVPTTKITAPTLPSINTGINLPKLDILGSLNAPKLSTLATAIGVSGLVSSLNNLGPFTMLTPTNDAFAKLPSVTLPNLLKPENLGQLQGLLKSHVLPGNVDLATVKDGEILKNLSGEMLMAKVQEGKLSIGNIMNIDTNKDISSNGASFYNVDQVLEAPNSEMTMASSLSTIVATTPASTTMQVSQYTTGNGLEALKKDGRFNTLLTAIKTAGLESTLEGSGPFTIFAPTDEAFASLGTAATDLLKPENKDKLANILKYHVVAGKNSFAEFTSGKALITLGGGGVTLGLDEHGQGIVKGVKNTALAPVEDIITANATIHILTKDVLLPS